MYVSRKAVPFEKLCTGEYFVIDEAAKQLYQKLPGKALGDDEYEPQYWDVQLCWPQPAPKEGMIAFRAKATIRFTLVDVDETPVAEAAQ